MFNFLPAQAQQQIDKGASFHRSTFYFLPVEVWGATLYIAEGKGSTGPTDRRSCVWTPPRCWARRHSAADYCCYQPPECVNLKTAGCHCSISAHLSNSATLPLPSRSLPDSSVQLRWGCLESCYSKYGLGTGSVGTHGYLVRGVQS